MKVGFVGTVTVFRQLSANGVNFGQIDVIQYGCNKYPTETFIINVNDSAYCRILLEQLSLTPTPLIRAILWLEVVKGEMKISLLELLSVNESLIDLEDSA